MKRKLLLTVIVIGIFAAPSLAQAVTPYVSANVGLGFPANSSNSHGYVISYKTSVPFGGAVGLKGDGYRVEAALSYVNNHFDQVYGRSYNDSYSNFSYMANAYYDYAINDSTVTPYVMGGIGGVSISPHGLDLNNYTTKSLFAWQIGAGIGVNVDKNVVVDLGYRYFKPSNYHNDITGSITTFASSNILLGVRYNF